MGRAVEKVDVRVRHPAGVVWKAMVEESHTTLHKAAPTHFRKVEVVEGTGGHPGAVYSYTLGDNFGPAHGYSTAKNTLVEVDREQLVAKWKLLDGGGLGTGHWRSFYHTLHVVPAAAGACVVQHTIEYEIAGENTLHEHFKTEIIQTTRHVEAYLDAHPEFGASA